MKDKRTKIDLVTGGTRGLQKDMALRVAEQRTDVVFTYRTHTDEAKALVKEINAMERKAIYLPLDLEHISQLDAFISSLKNGLKVHFNTAKIDFLINNAGSEFYIPFSETTEAQFDPIMNIHFKSTYFRTQKMLSLMNDGGAVVNLSLGSLTLVRRHTDP